MRRVCIKRKEKELNTRSTNRCYRKSGKEKENRWWSGFARGVSFRKLSCGIEGKWKGGYLGGGCVPGVARFPQGRDLGLWICGCGAWKEGFGAELMLVF